jgi:predicted NAD/FAD-binding protein
VEKRIRYAHPVFDSLAIAAQARLPALQGRSHVWFCGAWTGFGFHEDGLKSGLLAADHILARPLPPGAGTPVQAGVDAPSLREAA